MVALSAVGASGRRCARYVVFYRRSSIQIEICREQCSEVEISREKCKERFLEKRCQK